MSFSKTLFLSISLASILLTENVVGQSMDYSTHTVDSLCLVAGKKVSIYPDSAFVTAQQVMHMAEQLDYTFGMANCLHIKGEVFYHQGFYNEALTNLLKAEQLYEGEHRDDARAENLNQLGLVYYSVHQPEVALEKHRQALAIYESLKDKKGTAYTNGCLGRLYEKKQQYDVALTYQEMALAYYEDAKDLSGTATILENIGSIKEDFAEYETAQQYFQRSLSLNEITRDSLSMIINLNNLADCYRKTDRNAEAVAYSERALALALRLNDKYQVVSAYKDLSKAYNQWGYYQEAYGNLEKGRTLYEELYGEETRRQVALLQTLFDVERKNGEIKILEAAQQVNSVIKIALVTGIGLLIMLAMAIISRQRLKIRQDKELIGRNESEQRLMRAELENAHLHEKRLQHELENRAKSLTAHTLHIISKNKILEDIQEKLKETLKDEMRDHRKKIANLLKLIDQNFVQDKDWDDFRSIFEQVHQEFFNHLQKWSTELTAADLRLAALIKLNLPSKDIATILGISQDSLRISRYRLRKKLNLKQGDSLSNFILSIGENHLQLQAHPEEIVTV